MDFELKSAKAKWEKEQREKVERARARVERERRAKEEAARRQQAMEEAQRQRRMEAAEAELEARQREEEDLQLGDGIRYNRILRASKVPGSGDKVILPAGDFEALSSEGALDKGPMFFRISPETGSSNAAPTFTHGGVLEFTSADGYVGLPPHVWRNAGLDSASDQEASIRIRYVRLPKGTYAKLQPVGLDFGDVPNHKAVLETTLRLHAALSVGDILSVPYGGMEYRLQVLELKPAPAVSVLETDIEVDVVSTLADERAGEKVVELPLGRGEAGAVEQGGYRYYKFHVENQLAEALNRGELELVIRLQIDGDGAASDADIYVAANPVLFPSQEEHQWASHATGSKVVKLSALLPGLYTVAVHGFRGVSKFVLSVEALPVDGKPSGQKLGAVTQQQAQDEYETCGNCKQLIPARTFTLHEVYCRRHNAVCGHPGCGLVLRKEEAGNHLHCGSCGAALTPAELEKHMSVYHSIHTCGCGAAMEMQEMVHHRAHECPQRRITCRFCGDVVEAGGQAADMRDKLKGLSQHESSCGSRTDPCGICKRAVMLKEMELHLAAVHAGPSPAAVATVGGATGDSDRVQAAAMPAAKVEEMATECPVCGGEFAGIEAFNAHFERVHLDDHPQRVAEPHSFSNFRQSLSVLCPICGMAVHSERDLSSHIDMVH